MPDCPGAAVLFFAAVGAVPVAELPDPGRELLGPEPGVLAGGSDVSGVGSGGSGLDKMLAIISFKPVSDLL